MKVRIKIGLSENASYYNVAIGTEIEEDLEKYVASVVASEIGNAPLEACKAQAVASRTFVYRYFLKNKAIPDGSTAQVFKIKRYSDVYSVCKRATDATKGQILIYEGSPADTYFCHSNGGCIVSSREKWGGSREYLVSKPDPWDGATHINRSGHGVGMSQVGAKYAANQGVSYKEILDFYYPGTAISVVKEKEECLFMISLSKFMEGCKRNAARIKGYKLACNGSNGLSDCIGYIIGSLLLIGIKWNGTHGSNYAARYRTKNLHAVMSASQLKLGQLVYKHNKPGTTEWNKSFPKDKYGNHPDQNDYYHVGVVTSVNPLEISHCSGGGMHYDKSLGKWSHAGECTLVEYSSSPVVTPIEQTTSETEVTGSGKAVVDVPDDTSVNIRSAASTSGKILVKANEGTVLDVISVSGSWAKVKYSFNKVGTGYVMSKFISTDGKIDVPNDTTVNVRIKATINSNKITTIPEGEKVKILSKSGEWSKIEYSVPKTGTGYVMSKYLKKG